MNREHRLIIKFDGGDADTHAVGMRALGRSLIGFDRLISDGIILVAARRLPKRGERAPVVIKAQEPRPGSHEIYAFIQEHSDELLLGVKILGDSSGNFIWEWTSCVLEYFGGRKMESQKHLDAILKLNAAHLAARDKSEERMLAEQDKWRNLLVRLIEREGRPAIEAVSAIGPSVRKLTLSTPTSQKTIIDEPMADAVRAKGEVEVSDLRTMSLKADGWIYHSRTLSVEHPDHNGKYISAKVRDPIGEEEPNVYADAARNKATITVQAKTAHRDAVLDSIYIMDFVGTVSD